MEKEILKLLAILTEDNLYRQVYVQQIKLLFDMLEREQRTYCQDGNPIVGGIIKNHTAGNFSEPLIKATDY
jgi:hypothetical protein